MVQHIWNKINKRKILKKYIKGTIKVIIIHIYTNV